MSETRTHPMTTAIVRRTQDELGAELVARFGPDPMDWAFECPACGDIATGGDFRAALAAAADVGEPYTRRDGSPVLASNLLGQQCIGRITGALDPARWKGWQRRGGKTFPKWRQRGCDWTAGGLFCGPDFIVLPDGEVIPCFAIAPADGEPPRQVEDVPVAGGVL